MAEAGSLRQAMACPNCDSETTADQRFCFKCGTSLALACSNCGSSLPEDAAFCGQCGTKVGDVTAEELPPEAAAADATPERRLVSVLFADLVGFTAASESRDPEDVRDFLSRYFELTSATIRRYGGTVDHFIGDAVMGVWGSPQAYEDDAERAVRAAFDLAADVAALGTDFEVSDLSYRAGIATGEAAVTLDAQTHRLVAGDLVNTASRLEGAAEPGTVLVNEVTQRTTSEAISYEPAGELELKGKSETVAVWRPLHIIALRGGAGRASGLEAPFVGRAAELQLLKDLFRATARDQRAHLVSVQGIPGIGKSRLVWEFEKYLDGLVDTTYWHQGRSPAYGEGVTFWALGEMVRRRASIVETDDHATTIRHLDETIDEFVPEDDRQWISAALQVLLGVTDAQGTERDELFGAWRTFFQHLSTRAPTVMVFEDLQWADHGTLDFIESLLEWSRDFPVFVITLARPELLDRRQNWGAGHRGFTGLHVEPLSAHEMEELLTGLAPGLPEEFSAEILGRAEGVPLYAVETIRMLIGQGHVIEEGDGFRVVGQPELVVPESLHALVAARLDTLDPGDRQLLQRASVLGQTFTTKALADLADLAPGEVEAQLEPLVRREILGIEADPRSPERGQYRFVQSVIREVAYSSLSRDERSALHVRVAELLEGLGDDELAGVIASHLVDASEALPAGPEAEALVGRARIALRKAAERAATLGSHEQALAYLEMALDTDPDPDSRADLWLEAAARADDAGRMHDAESYIRQAIDWLRSQGDQTAEVSATVHLGSILAGESRIEEAIETLEAALSVDPRGPDTARLQSQLARAYAFHGDGAQALEAVDEALKAAGVADDLAVVTDAMVTRGWALQLEGRTREGQAVTEGALSLAQRHSLQETELRARNNVSAFILWDEPQLAFDTAIQGMDLARKVGKLDWVTALATRAVTAAVELGRWEWALETIEDVRQPDLSFFARLFLDLSTAQLLAYRGEHDKAAEIIEELRPAMGDTTSKQDQWAFVRSEAWTALVNGQPERAYELAMAAQELRQLRYFAEDLALAVQAVTWTGDAEALESVLAELRESPASPRLSVSVKSAEAALAVFNGDEISATELFGQAASQAKGMGLVWPLALTQLSAATLLNVNSEAGKAATDEARQIFTELGAKPFLERLDELEARA